jgi:prepilin-type N-terminal cleavage/methylation domain-containing protein
MVMASMRRGVSRGFTLVELLTVVTIVGILSAVAIVLVGGHVKAARTTEALSMVQSIRAAEESYRAENRSYLNVSGTLQNFYPVSTPDGKSRAFYQEGGKDLDRNWNILHPSVAGPVRFVYAVVAGAYGETPPVPDVTDKPTFAKAQAPFYVIQAAGNFDNDSVYCIVAATSFGAETYVENEGE